MLTSSEINAVLSATLDSLPSSADFSKGYVKLNLKTLDGSSATMLLQNISDPVIRKKLLHDYANGDWQGMLRGALPKFADTIEVFVRDLERESFATLLNSVAMMLFGPDEMKKLIRATRWTKGKLNS